MNDAYCKALDFLTVKNRSAKQIKTYLKKQGYAEDDIQYCIEKLKEYGFINETYYAESLVRKYKSKNYSLARIEANLKNEGIDEDIRTDILLQLGDEYELESLYKFLAKELKNREIDRTVLTKIKNKAFRWGFKAHFIEEALINAATQLTEEKL